ncbi:hypothetical protein BIV57_15905 [Mangrovactinospora gilvigrisea]|uniref:Uncharacterized protein n=2 Tax=Mangrovactinospora gilvigrisea TaxID=1428644 RepID=A0A1J7C4M4_9ACTN|nr:hypothetical protein BIV57_15905 [Mangrovactinospora gilvigrisea]
MRYRRFDEALKEGDAAARSLADALEVAGFKLPSLSGDFPAIDGAALVRLGGCSSALAFRLAEWIREHA